MNKSTHIFTEDLLRRVGEHCETMRAFLDGAEIEYRYGDRDWRPTPYPTWTPGVEYRVKPKPEVRWLVSRVRLGSKIENIFKEEDQARRLLRRLDAETRSGMISTEIRLIKLTEDNT